MEAAVETQIPPLGSKFRERWKTVGPNYHAHLDLQCMDCAIKLMKANIILR